MTVCPKASCSGELLSRMDQETGTLLLCSECGETYKGPSMEAPKGLEGLPPEVVRAAWDGGVDAYRSGRWELALELLNFYTRPAGPEGMLGLLESIAQATHLGVDVGRT